MALTKDKIKAFLAARYDGYIHFLEELRGNHKLLRADFNDGSKTMYNYLNTHRNKYRRRIGASFIMKLYEIDPMALERFSERQSLHGWHFRLDDTELAALCSARDETCTYTRISGLKYATNLFDQIANKKQIARMIGLGAVAGSAGILLGLGELLFFAKQYSKDLMESTFGVSWNSEPDSSANTEFVDIANRITDGATNPDGSLDALIVADRIAELVETIEASENAEQAVTYLNADFTYIIGIVTGIVILVIGRGVVQLAMEGFAGTVAKIDALIADMDAYCEWKLGRSPYPSDIDPARLEAMASTEATDAQA